ncbi:MAG: uroporphyrinogen-III synthase [Thiohalocapsa sp.]
MTRPRAQAEALCRRIEAAGGRAVRFPTVEIRPVSAAGEARARLLAPRDLIVFISRNAVEQAQALLGGRPLPRGVRLAAVGRATAEAMREAGMEPDLVPDAGYDSESLLALPALRAVAGARALIVRGEGGRPLLGQTLKERGAEVVYAEVYRRVVPDVDATVLVSVWRQSIAYVTATSDEVLTNLLAMVPASAHAWLFSLPLVVLGPRNVETARGLGFRSVDFAGEASDEAIVRALCRARSSEPVEA